MAIELTGALAPKGTGFTILADSINVDFSNTPTDATTGLKSLNASTTDGVGDHFVVVDSETNASYKLAKGSIAISGFSNDSNFSTTVGTVTSVTASTGISVGGTSAVPTIAVSGLDISDFTGSSIQYSAEAFSDNDTSLMSSAAVKNKIEAYGYSTTTGDITGVSITHDDGGSLNEISGNANFTLTGGTGLATSGTGSTITFTLDAQLEDIAGMTELVTTALASLAVNEINSLDTTTSISTSLAAKALLAGDSTQNFDALDLTVAGNLTVSGTHITTATETLEIADNTLVLNSDNAGASVDAGLVVQLGTGSANNPSLWFDVTASSADTTGRWVVGSTDDATAAIGGYVADVMQVRIDNGAINTASTEVPIGHMQYHGGELYLRVEN